MSLEVLRNNLPSVNQITQQIPSVDTIRSTLNMAPEIPKTHKAAMFKESGGKLVIEEIETKQPQQNEVLVKVLACGVCHSEVVAQMGMFGPML